MVAEFKHGKESLDVDPHSGGTLTVTTPEIVAKVHDMVMDDRWVTERCIDSSVGISQEIVHSILTEDLNMRKLSARWVPRLLTVDQRHTRQNMSRANLNLFYETDPEKFLLGVWRLMQLGSNISYQNPNNSLNNGMILAHPAKEDKVWFDNWEVYCLGFVDAYGILMEDYFQKKNTSCDWKVKVKYKSVSIYVYLNNYNYEHHSLKMCHGVHGHVKYTTCQLLYLLTRKHKQKQ